MQISNSNSRNNSKPKRSDCSGHVSKLGLGLLAMCQAKSSQAKRLTKLNKGKYTNSAQVLTLKMRTKNG